MIETLGKFFSTLFAEIAERGALANLILFIELVIAVFFVIGVIALIRLVKVQRQTLKFFARATKEGYFKPKIVTAEEKIEPEKDNVEVAVSKATSEDVILTPSSDVLEIEEGFTVEEFIESEQQKVIVPKKTIEEKYNLLAPVDKAYYDEVMSYAEALKGVKRSKSLIADSVIYGRDTIVKTQIKQGSVVCSFLTADPEMRRLLKAEKATVKEKLTVIKLTDSHSVAIVKQCVDLAYKASDEEKRIKHQNHLKKRRENRKAKQNKA